MNFWWKLTFLFEWFVLFINWFTWLELIKKLGLTEYDPDGEKARALEDAIGINVIRHSMLCFPFWKICSFVIMFY